MNRTTNYRVVLEHPEKLRSNFWETRNSFWNFLVHQNTTAKRAVVFSVYEEIARKMPSSIFMQPLDEL